MSGQLWHFDVASSSLALRAVVVYVVVLLLLRISGKRQMGQMGATEFVAILLISNAVQNSMNGGDNSLIGGIWLAFILILMSTLISYLTFRYEFFSQVFEGTPTLLINKGKVLKKNMHRERLSMSELRMLLRKQDVHQIEEVSTAVLEADGTLSIAKTGDRALIDLPISNE